MMDWLAPANQSRLLPERSEMSPTRAVRAAMPGTSPTAPKIPMAMNHGRVAPTVVSTAMSHTTEAAEIMSEITLMRLRPYRSMTSPPMIATMMEGSRMQVATRPAAAGSPVRCSTSQGHTTLEMALPSADDSPEPR